MVLFLKAIMSLLTSLAIFVSGNLFGNFTDGIKPSKENCELTFAAISDIHITDSYARQTLLEMGFSDMDAAEAPLDALVLAGDTTNKAYRIEYERVADAFSKYTPAKNIILATGNHDLWNIEVDKENRFPESEKLFIEYNKTIADREINKTYYSTQVNGYSFIVIGGESDTTRGTVSQQQLLWLENEMAKAAKQDKPIFVISHWPLEDTHGQPEVWVGSNSGLTPEEIEEQDNSSFADGKSADVERILKKYENVFLISGHLHNGIAEDFNRFGYEYSTIESDGSFHSINLPTYQTTMLRGAMPHGMGMYFEVYDNEVIIRSRDFSSEVWHTNLTFNIPLV